MRTTVLAIAVTVQTFAIAAALAVAGSPAVAPPAATPPAPATPAATPASPATPAKPAAPSEPPTAPAKPAAPPASPATPAAAPAAAAPTAPHATVRLQLNWVPEPEFGGFYAAVQDGLYAARGITVEIIRGASGTPTPQLTATGQVEFGIVSGDQILSFAERGANLVGVFAVFHTSPMGIMVKADAPWKTLEELWKSDATIAMEAGLPFVKYLNARFGAGTVKIIPTGTGLAAFERGTVQAQQCFISAEPVQMELKGQRVRVFSLAAGGYDPYTVTVATRREYLEANRGVCERFVQATREGWVRYLANPAKYNPAMHALNPAMSMEAMAAAAVLQDPLVAPAAGSAVPVGWMTAERWARLAEQMKELGLIKSVPTDVRAAFWNAPVQPAP